MWEEHDRFCSCPGKNILKVSSSIQLLSCDISQEPLFHVVFVQMFKENEFELYGLDPTFTVI